MSVGKFFRGRGCYTICLLLGRGYNTPMTRVQHANDEGTTRQWRGYNTPMTRVQYTYHYLWEGEPGGWHRALNIPCPFHIRPHIPYPYSPVIPRFFFLITNILFLSLSFFFIYFISSRGRRGITDLGGIMDHRKGTIKTCKKIFFFHWYIVWNQAKFLWNFGMCKFIIHVGRHDYNSMFTFILFCTMFENRVNLI